MCAVVNLTLSSENEGLASGVHVNFEMPHLVMAVNGAAMDLKPLIKQR